ncbi:pyrroline-5-carboxylate reductase [Myxococcota bacterium]|nr:pyrroline-5-carboxylate reductase [Myxococcota bacterium]
MFNKKTAIIGCGNIGLAIAKGLSRAKDFSNENLMVTTRSDHSRKKLEAMGFTATTDNAQALDHALVLIVAVTPQQVDSLFASLAPHLAPHHIILSVVSGVSCATVRKLTGKENPVIRIMPNTAAAIGESMTCVAYDRELPEALALAMELFGYVGKCMVLTEEMMVPATVLCACGTAFFLRAIRAASQGGIEIGFHPDQAIPLAAQVAKGAAALLDEMENHPETEIDKVTTPKGSTITGLNTMEHQGFSSAMIQGILASYNKTTKLYS